jgi:hypothetical protein
LFSSPISGDRTIEVGRACRFICWRRATSIANLLPRWRIGVTEGRSGAKDREAVDTASAGVAFRVLVVLSLVEGRCPRLQGCLRGQHKAAGNVGAENPIFQSHRRVPRQAEPQRPSRNDRAIALGRCLRRRRRPARGGCRRSGMFLLVRNEARVGGLSASLSANAAAQAARASGCASLPFGSKALPFGSKT